MNDVFLFNFIFWRVTHCQSSNWKVDCILGGQFKGRNNNLTHKILLPGNEVTEKIGNGEKERVFYQMVSTIIYIINIKNKIFEIFIIILINIK